MDVVMGLVGNACKSSSELSKKSEQLDFEMIKGITRELSFIRYNLSIVTMFRLFRLGCAKFVIKQ